MVVYAWICTVSRNMDRMRRTTIKKRVGMVALEDSFIQKKGEKMSLVDRSLIPMLKQEALRDWEDSHYLRPSKSVFNWTTAVHKNNDEPCPTNSCYQALRLQDLGITRGGPA